MLHPNVESIPVEPVETSQLSLVGQNGQEIGRVRQGLTSCYRRTIESVLQGVLISAHVRDFVAGVRYCSVHSKVGGQSQSIDILLVLPSYYQRSIADLVGRLEGLPPKWFTTPLNSAPWPRLSPFP